MQPGDTPVTIAAAESVMTLISLLFSGVTLTVIIGVAWKLSAMLATINTHLEHLKGLPERVGKVEQRVGIIERDVHNLWQAFRDYMSANMDDENKYIRFLRDWDARHQKETDERNS
jgi:hypothetical protein